MTELLQQRRKSISGSQCSQPYLITICTLESIRRLLKLEFYLSNQTINKIATVGNTVGLLPFKFLNVLFNIHAFAKKCTLLQNLMAY